MARVTRRVFFLLIVTALCWGSSFAFMKIAVEEIPPAAMMSLRCAIGALVLWPAVLWLARRRSERVRGFSRATHRDLFLNGAMTAVPFFLIAWGLQQLDSGVAGIVNASVPLWSAVLGVRWDQEHRTTRNRTVGIALGFAGVVLLFAVRGALDGSGELVALAAAASGALIYAVSGIFVRERLIHVPAASVAGWSVTWAAVLLGLAGMFELAGRVPHVSTAGVVSVVILGVVGTGAGMLAYYELIAVAGATRASLVTYLLPPLAVFYGVVLLEERVRIEALAAMVLILAGVAIASRKGGAGGQPAPGAMPEYAASGTR